MSPFKLDNKIPLLSPKTTLPTKLPVNHSTNDTLNFDGMDDIMEIIQHQENMIQYNKQKLHDFESKYNSMNSTFKRFASTTRTNLDSIVNHIDTVEHNFSANNKNHQKLQDLELRYNSLSSTFTHNW